MRPIKSILLAFGLALTGIAASTGALAHGYGYRAYGVPASPWIGHAGGPPPAWGALREGHGAWGHHGHRHHFHDHGRGHGHGHGHGAVVVEREVYVAPPPPPRYREPVYYAPSRPAVVISVPPIVLPF